MIGMDISIPADLSDQPVVFLNPSPGCTEPDRDRVDVKVRLSLVER